jgi:hypothetical protein
MAELADALDLGSSAVKGVQVQILFPAPALRSAAQRSALIAVLKHCSTHAIVSVG